MSLHPPAPARKGDRVAFRKPDHDSVRVTAVMHTLDEAPIPAPNVDAVEVDGEEARVRLSGANGIHAVVHLRKAGARWVVNDVVPFADAADEPSAAADAADRRAA